MIRYGISSIKRTLITNLPYIGKSLVKPSNIKLSITNRCNINCSYCYINKKPTKECTTSEIKANLRILKDWIGAFHLTITGGEPLLREDLGEILAFANRLGIITNLLTNGLLLDQKKISELKKTKVNLVTVSLDTIQNKKNHQRDNINIIQIKNNILMANAKLKTRIGTVISKSNIHELPSIIKWTKKNGLNGVNFQPILLHPDQMKNQKAKERQYLSKNEIKTLEELIQMKKQGYPITNSIRNINDMKMYFQEKIRAQSKCSVGTESVQIESDGKIKLCRFLLDIKANDLQKEWQKDTIKRTRKRIQNCKRPCHVLNCYNKKTLKENISTGLKYIIP